MIISKTKSIAFLALLVSSSTFSMTPDNCKCKTQQLKVAECSIKQTNGPSWWNWLTSNESSQFHLFQLMELLHTNDSSDSSVMKNSSEQLEQTS